MHKLVWFLLCGLLAVSARPAAADCVVADPGQDGAGYRLGDYPIGIAAAELAAVAGPFEDCTLAQSGCVEGEQQFAAGKDGLRYYLEDGRLVRKTLSTGSSYRKPLIAGLHLGAPLAQSREILARQPLPSGAIDQYDAHGKTGAILYTDLCWQGTGDRRWGLALFHNPDGKLIRIDEFADFVTVDRTGRDCAGDVVDVPDRDYSLGSVPMGPLPATPRSAGLHDCSTETAAGCGASAPPEGYRRFVDGAGVGYLVNYIDQIVGKDLQQPAHYHRPLPAGLRAGDDRATVLRKLANAPLLAAQFRDAAAEKPDQPGTELRSRYCLRSSTGRVWAYVLTFDPAGRLSAIAQDGGPLPEQ